ncbi:uncharacterized protein LOC106012539 [Aplysia californica]|uniref:ribonuclease H n=1 Tax=Aplysia californica TaxID=6500 RepID=A0ABM1A5K3_APLCA|nr:uncharacterized protein LOC106012539 [Aplysia californica]
MPLAKPSNLQKLERKQNEAARIITGCSKDTRVDSLLIEADILPLRHRADALTAISFEKSMRLPTTNQRKASATKSVPTRTCKSNWRKHAQNLVAETELDTYPREELVVLPPPTKPWKAASYNVTFSTDLVADCKRANEPAVRKAAAEATIRSLPLPDVEVWTDGSAEHGTEYGGSGILIKTGDTELDQRVPAGRYCSSYRAELVALDTALDMLVALHTAGSLPNSARIHVYTDSRSAVMRLSYGPTNQSEKVACSIWQHLHTLCQRSECSIHLQWIPGHARLAGNEEVDNIAKEATALTQIDTPINFSTAKAVIHRSTRAKWKREAKPKLPFAQPPSFQLEASLRRQDRRLLSQMRTVWRPLLRRLFFGQ